jgi:membrane protease YdiL (CAAX protease family)
MKHWPAIVPFLLPLLLEAFFYFISCFPRLEGALLRLPPLSRALALSVSGALPVLLILLSTGQTPGLEFYWLCAALLLVSCWHLLLPVSSWTDIGLLALLTALILSGWGKVLYPETTSGLRLNGLSKLLWLRVGIQSFMYLREFKVPRTGFWPNNKEWWNGAGFFLALIVLFVPVGLHFGFLRWQLPDYEPWQLPFLAVGYFWVVLLFLAYGEEYLVRGVLQTTLQKMLKGNITSLLITSLCFGAIHLPFRNQFPNWRFAAVATIAGIFYGLAFRRANSLRAAMVTHALTVTCWTMLFARSI